MTQSLIDNLPEAVSAPNPAVGRPRRLVGAAATVAAAIGLVIWWYAGLRNQFFPDNFGVVVPGKIYRSAQISRRILRQTLQVNHIDVIIDLSHEKSADAIAERQIAADMGLQQIHFKLSGDGTGDPNVYPAAIKAIIDSNRQGKAVLVHCQSGAERTGGVVAVYRMLIEGRSRDEAFAETERFHHHPHSNPRLYPFVEDHLAQWKAQLQAEHLAPADR